MKILQHKNKKWQKWSLYFENIEIKKTREQRNTKMQETTGNTGMLRVK